MANLAGAGLAIARTSLSYFELPPVLKVGAGQAQARAVILASSFLTSPAADIADS